MQKSVYRVRTQKNISQRIAIDMQREEQSQGRLQTITMLHNELDSHKFTLGSFLVNTFILACFLLLLN
jgi:hypothetical protein